MARLARFIALELKINVCLLEPLFTKIISCDFWTYSYFSATKIKKRGKFKEQVSQKYILLLDYIHTYTPTTMILSRDIYIRQELNKNINKIKMKTWTFVNNVHHWWWVWWPSATFWVVCILSLNTVLI